MAAAPPVALRSSLHGLLDTPPPKKVTLTTADGATRELTFTHVPATNRLVLRKPGVPIASQWSVTLQ